MNDVLCSLPPDKPQRPVRPPNQLVPAGCCVILAALLFLSGCLFRTVQRMDAAFSDPVSEAEFQQWATQNTSPGNVYNSLWKLNDWAGKNMTYVADGPIDVPRDPRVTLRILQGDCDDHSWLYAKALEYIGVSPRLVSVFRAGGGHTVCAVTLPSGIYHISNWAGVYGPYADDRALADSIHPEWTNFVVRLRDFTVLGRVSRLPALAPAR